MKRIIVDLFAAGIAICLAAACAKETAPSANVTTYEPLTVNGTVGTKTVLDGASVKWLPGDEISIFSTTVSPYKNDSPFTTDIEAASESAVFKGNVLSGTTSIVAIYPYDAEATYEEGEITTALPVTQTATASSFGNSASVAFAKGTKTPGDPSVDLHFSNLCAVLKFTLPSNITFADEITVSSKDLVGMAGEVTIDCGDTPAITSASSTSVVLTGEFEGGKEYFITVAPGTYTNGFKFDITTKGGNSYSRETSKEVVAVAGEITNLGILSLAVAESSVTSSSVAIAHTYESNVLTGSTAQITVSVSVPSEFESLVSGWSLKNVKVSQAGVDFRSTSEVAFTSGTPVTIDVVSGKPYLPKGEYTYTADACYIVNNGTKDVTRTITVTGTATSPAPDASKFSLDAYLGYTSYSCYKGTDGQSKSISNANACNNSTVYIYGTSDAARFKSGLSQDVFNQCKELLVMSNTKLDGTAKSGDVSGQTWAAHTLTADISFDSSTPKAATETVYVTGLPLNPNNEKMVNTKQYFSFGDDAEWKEQNELIYIRPKNGGNKITSINFNPFHIPADIKTTLTCRYAVYGSGADVNFYAGDYEFKRGGALGWNEYDLSQEVNFSSSSNKIRITNTGNSSSWATAQSWYKYVTVKYKDN